MSLAFKEVVGCVVGGLVSGDLLVFPTIYWGAGRLHSYILKRNWKMEMEYYDPEGYRGGRALFDIRGRIIEDTPTGLARTDMIPLSRENREVLMWLKKDPDRPGYLVDGNTNRSYFERWNRANPACTWSSALLHTSFIVNGLMDMGRFF